MDQPLTVHLKLPEDLSAKVRELAGERIPKDIIIDALRKFWFPAMTVEPEIPALAYPIWGSIPAGQKTNV